MNLVRWDPFRELEQAQDRLNRMFSRTSLIPTGAEEELVGADWAPAVDIQETDKEFIVKTELPEVKREDVRVEVKDDVLFIQGERRQEKEEKGKRYHRVERSYGKFLRSFMIPNEVDEMKLTAEFKDGVLNVHLPKSEKAKPKAIEVKVASE